MPRPPKPEKGVFERVPESGIWWIRFADETGRIHRECVGMRSAAISAYHQKKTEVREGRFIPAKMRHRNCTLNELLDDYLKSCKARQIRDIRTVEGRLRVWKSLGDKIARTITIGEIESVLLRFANGKPFTHNCIRKASKRAPATVKKALMTLKSCLNYAERNGKMENNPARTIKPPKENNKRVRFLSHDEEKRLLNVIPVEYHAEVRLAIMTGLRKMELFSLKWSDINFQQRLIMVRDSKNGQGRVVPMSQTAFDILKSIIRRVDNPFVFPGEAPASHRVDHMLRWEKYLVQAEIEDFKWHDLRHTTASRLAMAGVDLYTISKILGHSDISMSARYAHLSPGFLKDAMVKLDGVISEPTGTKTGTNEK
jgi:integrase